MDIGLHTHFDDPNTILDPLILGMARDIELGAWEGNIWNLLRAPDEAITQEKFEIYDRSRTALTGVIGDGAGTGWADGTDTTDLPMTAAAVGVLTVGDVLEVEDEQVIVSSVDRSANTIDVFARGHGSTSGAAHVDTTAFTVIGKAINDTDLKDIESFAELSGKYSNVCQLVAETIDMTFTDETEARKAFVQKPQLIEEALDRIFRKLSKSAIKGVKSEGTKTLPATTAGILEQLSAGGGVRTPLRYNGSGITAPETLLKNALIACWNAGGNPDTILLSPANKRKFDALMEQFIRMNRGEASVVGTDNATAFAFQGKTLQFVQDQDMPDARIEIVTLKKLQKGWKTGDILRGPVKEPQQSSRELRYSLQGKFFVIAKGVGVDHIDIHTVSLA